MFTIRTEYTIELQDFKAWAGGKDRLDEAIKYDMVHELQDYIIQLWGTDELTDTQLNDTLWFECDDFLAEVLEEIE